MVVLKWGLFIGTEKLPHTIPMSELVTESKSSDNSYCIFYPGYLAVVGTVRLDAKFHLQEE